MRKRRKNDEKVLHYSTRCAIINHIFLNRVAKSHFCAKKILKHSEFLSCYHDFSEGDHQTVLKKCSERLLSGNNNSRGTYMISVKEAVDFLIELFNNTYQIGSDGEKKHYSISNIKVGKMLTLSAILYANCHLAAPDDELFSESIVALNCGTTINNIEIIDIPNVSGTDTAAIIDEKSIHISELREFANTLERRVLLYIFRLFGAYSSRNIGQYIDLYKPDCKEFSKLKVDEFNITQSVSIPADLNLQPFNNYIHRFETLE